MKDETNPRYLTLEKETIKKTTVKNEIRKLAETLKKIHQKKPPSHRNINKPTRRRNIIVSTFLDKFVLYFLTTVKSSKKRR